MATNTRLFAFAFLLAVPVLSIYNLPDKLVITDESAHEISSKDYLWQQILPFGNGSPQNEWKAGTFPMGLKPILAFDSKLWIVGQKSSWTSADGKNWEQHPKADWGERISINQVFFNNKLWALGGTQYQARELLNEVWFSPDGIGWQKAKNAAWEPRKGFGLVSFKNKLWLFGGVTKLSQDFESVEMKNDIWSSLDGLNWTKEVDQAPWSPRDSPHVITLRDSLYLIGGQRLQDVWRSADGKTWEQVTNQAEWGKRFDQGVAVFDDKMWVYGGRDTLTNHNLAAQNDVWSSVNGKNWILEEKHAPWTVRSGSNSVVYKDQLWLYSGKHTGGNPVWKGDIWVMKKQ
jgi:hypothetical protein